MARQVQCSHRRGPLPVAGSPHGEAVASAPTGSRRAIDRRPPRQKNPAISDAVGMANYICMEAYRARFQNVEWGRASAPTSTWSDMGRLTGRWPRRNKRPASASHALLGEPKPYFAPRRGVAPMPTGKKSIGDAERKNVGQKCHRLRKFRPNAEKLKCQLDHRTKTDCKLWSTSSTSDDHAWGVSLAASSIPSRSAIDTAPASDPTRSFLIMLPRCALMVLSEVPSS